MVIRLKPFIILVSKLQIQNTSASGTLVEWLLLLLPWMAFLYLVLVVSLKLTDTQDKCVLLRRFRKQFDTETIKVKTEANAQSFQFTTHEITHIYAYRVEILFIKGRAEFDSNLRNRYIENFSLEYLPFKLKCIANEKELDHEPVVDEPVIHFNTFEKIC